MAEIKSTHEKVTELIQNSGGEINGIKQNGDQTAWFQAVNEGLTVNPNSNFVVVTYWWGRNNNNRNIARPCGSFYEDYIKKCNKLIVNLIYSTKQRIINEQGEKTKEEVVEQQNQAVNAIFKNLAESPNKFPTLMGYVLKMVQHYMADVCQHYNIEQKRVDPCKLLFASDDTLSQEISVIKPKLQGNTEELFTKAYKVICDGIIKNKDNLIKLSDIQTEFNDVKAKYLSEKENFTRNNPLANRDDLEASFSVKKQDVDKLVKQKTDLGNELIKTLKIKEGTPLVSIFDRLIEIFEYVPPQLFQNMIDDWKRSCRSAGCNYLVIEYPEFAAPGGYQLAINAKPKFIAKALELCNSPYAKAVTGNKELGVLYIDGDMHIKQYPGIFDMTEIDFMARGWWMDPRANWKMSESIMYDPYNFETSGGTMFFNATEASYRLLNLWINTAELPSMEGKADDRVLSLIFNTKGCLTWMKVIQLPVEYLWLTLDYDERMMSEVYDYNKPEMDSTIIIEHPHCLTSEDTAAGAGASNNRQPKFYDFLEDVYPCSEITYEYIMFKHLIDKARSQGGEILPGFTEYMKMTDEEINNKNEVLKKELAEKQIELEQAVEFTKKENLKQEIDNLKKQIRESMFLPYLFWYYHYMGDVQYLDDGNANLYDLDYVDPEYPEDAAYPLTIVSYKEKFGNKPHPSADGETTNQIVELNIKEANKPNNEEGLIQESNVTVETVEINSKTVKVIVPNDSKSFQIKKEFIRLLLKYLNKGETVIINPANSPGYNIVNYTLLAEKLVDRGPYSNLELIFYPDLPVQIRASSYYKPGINFTQPMYFNPKDSRLMDFISLHLSLDDFSTFLSNGNYEFMSLIRVGYLRNAPISSDTSSVTATTQLGGTNAYFTEFKNSKVMLDNYTKELEEAMSIDIPDWLNKKTVNKPTEGGTIKNKVYKKSTRKKRKYINKSTRQRRK